MDEAKERVLATLDERADEVISKYMWAAGGAAAINPFPLLDLAGGSAITVKMVLDLAGVYGQKIDADTIVTLLGQLGKNLVAMVGATAAAPAIAAAVGSLLKTVPGIGTIAGGVVQGLVQALVTRWIGRVFCEYFRNEMQPPPGGLAELARREWAEVTRPEQLRKLIQLGRERLCRSAIDVHRLANDRSWTQCRIGEPPPHVGLDADYEAAMASVRQAIEHFRGCSPEERASLQRDLDQLHAMAEKLAAGKVEIVVFGEISTGQVGADQCAGGRGGGRSECSRRLDEGCVESSAGTAPAIACRGWRIRRSC